MSSDTIDLTVSILPEHIKQNWIPLDGQSVPHLFQFIRYPPQPMLYYNHSNLGQLLHEERITNFDPYTLLQLGPPPPQLSDGYKNAIKAAPLPIHSFTLVPISGHPVKLPIWLLEYWREIDFAIGHWKRWKDSLKWLKKIHGLETMVEVCNQVMAGLSFFPWNGGSPLRLMAQ